MQSVRAAVSREDHAPLSFEELELEAPRADEVVVEVAYTAICHTDIRAVEGLQGSQKPAVFGHEGAGIVRAIGSGVTKVKVGDRVVMTHLSCGRCASCLAGDTAYCRQNLPLNMRAGRLDGSSGFCGGEVHSHFFGQSSFATFSLANERNVTIVPDDIPLDCAAAMSCGIVTGAGAVLNVLKPAPGGSVVITGAGGVGLGAVMAARIAGASQVITIDLWQPRLDLAREVGATHCFEAADPHVVEKVREACGGAGATASVEASGSTTALAVALDVLGLHGTCVLVGAGGAVPASFTWRHLQYNALTIRGCLLGDSNVQLFMPRLFSFFRQGLLPVDRIISHYDFAQINEAMRDAAAGGPVKPVLRIANGALG